jgi:hypothetical protein
MWHHFSADAVVSRVIRPEVPLRREGKFGVDCGGGAPPTVDVAGLGFVP